MSIRPIVKWGDPVLHRPSEPVPEIDGSVAELLQDMVETMYAASGVGLAANQVGVTRRIAVIDLSVGARPEDLLVLINPEIVEVQGSVSEEEGCLSFPGITEILARPERVVMRALNLDGAAYTLDGTGLMARAICHEVDHLNGVLFVDRLTGFKKERVRKQVKQSVRKGEWEEVYP